MTATKPYVLFFVHPQSMSSIADAIADACLPDGWRLAGKLSQQSHGRSPHRDAIARSMTARVARLLQLVPAGALLVVRWMRLDVPWSWMDELLGYSVYATNQFSSGMGIRESSALLVDWTGVDSDANSPETDVWAEVCARRIWSPA
jgi:hypothetical protein